MTNQSVLAPPTHVLRRSIAEEEQQYMNHNKKNIDEEEHGTATGLSPRS